MARVLGVAGILAGGLTLAGGVMTVMTAEPQHRFCRGRSRSSFRYTMGSSYLTNKILVQTNEGGTNSP